MLDNEDPEEMLKVITSGISYTVACWMILYFKYLYDNSQINGFKYWYKGIFCTLCRKMWNWSFWTNYIFQNFNIVNIPKRTGIDIIFTGHMYTVKTIYIQILYMNINETHAQPSL